MLFVVQRREAVHTEREPGCDGVGAQQDGSHAAAPLQAREGVVGSDTWCTSRTARRRHRKRWPTDSRQQRKRTVECAANADVIATKARAV